MLKNKFSCKVGPRLIGPPLGLQFFTFISSLPLQRGKITLKTIIWDHKMLTLIDGEPLKAGLLSLGSLYLHAQTNINALFYLSYTKSEKMKNNSI